MLRPSPSHLADIAALSPAGKIADRILRAMALRGVRFMASMIEPHDPYPSVVSGRNWRYLTIWWPDNRRDVILIAPWGAMRRERR